MIIGHRWLTRAYIISIYLRITCLCAQKLFITFLSLHLTTVRRLMRFPKIYIEHSTCRCKPQWTLKLILYARRQYFLRETLQSKCNICNIALLDHWFMLITWIFVGYLLKTDPETAFIMVSSRCRNQRWH